MRPLAATLLAGILAGGISFGAQADIYHWTDAGGTVHFTEVLANVPSEHREEAHHKATGPREAQHFQQYRSDPQLQTALLAGAPAGGAIRVPFQREGNLIRLTVRLNDKLEAPFYLDTGATGIVLPQGVADRLGFRGTEHSDQVQVTTLSGNLALPTMKLQSVELGGVKVANLTGMVTPTTEVGLLGGAFFSGFSYAVDPVEQVLILRRTR